MLGTIRELVRAHALCRFLKYFLAMPLVRCRMYEASKLEHERPFPLNGQIKTAAHTPRWLR